MHGGEVRYWISRVGERSVSPRVFELLAEEEERELGSLTTLQGFAASVRSVREELVALLERLRSEGRTVAGYGATAKSATVNNFCGIGPDLVAKVYDTTPAKQGRLAPGTHIPVVPMELFAEDRPDYLLLYAWNHATEIRAKEQDFSSAGGRWITYVPDVRVT